MRSRTVAALAGGGSAVARAAGGGSQAGSAGWALFSGIAVSRGVACGRAAAVSSSSTGRPQSRLFAGGLGLAFLLLCAAQATGGETDRAELAGRAERLQRGLLVADTHIDTPTFALEHPDFRFAELNETGHVDLPRLRRAGVDAPFLVVYTPSDLEGEAALLHALGLADRVNVWIDELEALVPGLKPDDLVAAHAAEKIAAVLAMENGSPILPGRLDLLRTFHRLGVRCLSLAHFRSNHLADSSTDAPRHGGVSGFGRAVIREANRLGIILDVSHLSDDAVRAHLELSRAPIIASHSNARALCDHPRNLPDDLIRGIAAKGGVIQLNFAAQYVSQVYLELDEARKRVILKRTEELKKRWQEDPERLEHEIKALEKTVPRPPRPPLEEWFRHLDHIVRLVGPDHVGLGSDFDGIGAAPQGIEDVTSLRLVTEGLLARGWSREAIAKFYGGNLLRVWRAVEGAAER